MSDSPHEIRVEDGPPIDLRRLPYEIERLGVPYRPGLFSRFDPDGVAILEAEDGPVLGKFPYYRLISPSMSLLVKFVEDRAANVAEADQLKAILRDGGFSCPPESDFIFIHLAPGYRVALHRGHAVAEWPESDMEMPPEPPNAAGN